MLFAMTLGIMKQGIIGKELISTGDQGKFRLALEFDKSTSIKQNNLIAQKIETSKTAEEPTKNTVPAEVSTPAEPSSEDKAKIAPPAFKGPNLIHMPTAQPPIL